MEAAPKLYDITSIPIFPYIPGMVWWILLLCFLGAIVLLVGRIPVRRSRRIAGAFAEAFSEMSTVQKTASTPKEKLSSASLITRRLITTAEAINLRGTTAAEMQTLAGSLHGAIEAVLRAAALIEDQRFHPAVSDTEALTAIEGLLKTLRLYHAEKMEKQNQKP